MVGLGSAFLVTTTTTKLENGMVAAFDATPIEFSIVTEVF